MTAVVRVQQFFNQEGLEAFPRLFAEHCRQAATFEGFISLERSGSETGGKNGEIEMTLAFENGTLLAKWRSSPQHRQVAAAYARYWIRPPEVVFGSQG